MTINVDYFSRRRSTAFTLVELMISIALALLLILGVNQIFKYTTQAVGAGQAITADIQASRAVQATLSTDMNGIVGNGLLATDGPSIVISSRALYAYRNAQDQASEGTLSTNAPTTGGYPTNNAAFIDLAGNGQFGDPSVPGNVVWPCVYNFRNHRLDTFSFFSRGGFHRQTGNPGTFVDNMANTEAWIWYGHLWLPTNDSSSTSNLYGLASSPPTSLPLAGNAGTSAGLAQNPNNYYASQLVLGRVTTVLSEKSVRATASQAANTVVDQSGYQQWFFDRSSGTTATGLDPLTPLSPLSFWSQLNTTAYSTSSTDPGPTNLYNSRVDLASTSISNYRQKLQNFIAANPYAAGNSNTWWWTYLMDGSTTSFNHGYSRFQCNPFVAKPMQSVDMAHASPYLIGGCSQFIVEFAGDFVTQDNDPTHVDLTGKPSDGTSPNFHTAYGDVIATTPKNTSTGTPASTASDGQLDFTIVKTVDTLGNITYQRQIKWYGMPRGTAGQASVGYANGDVVPVRDWLLLAVDQSVGGALPLADPILSPLSFEGNPFNPKADYTGAAGLSVTDAQNGYTCAFGPNDLRPKLIRITMTLEDPAGRLPDGQTYQYVFQVP